ncbi:MAG: outer membrane beta-barrel protein [Nitratireductor sp.]
MKQNSIDGEKLKTVSQRWLMPLFGIALAVGAGMPVFLLNSTGALAQQASRPETSNNNSLFRLRGSNDVNAARVEDPFNGESVFEPAPGSSVSDADATAVVPLSDDPTGREQRAQRESQVVDPINTATPDSRANVRAAPVEAGNLVVPEDEPYLPQGFRAGTWSIFTRVEQALGYTTNTTSSAGGNGGLFSQTDATFRAQSDWSRHQAGLEATATIRRSGDEDTIPDLSVKGNVRLDLVDGFAATASGGYRYTTEALTSNSLGSTVSERPGVHSLTGSAQVERSGGKLDIALRGSLERTLYNDATLSGGGILSQSDRNNTLYQVSARAAYGSTDALKPFVQAGIGWRVHDEKTDRNGEERDSVIYDLRTGLQVDLGPKLKGEVSVGYLSEDFSDANIDSLSGMSLNAGIDWSPVRETQIRLSAATTFGGSTTAGDNGSINQNVSLEGKRRVRDNLELNAKASIDVARYGTSGGMDVAYTTGAGLEYWISRFLSVTADVEHQQFNSATAGNSWDATSFRLGVAVQR